ncbi:hypothetical protein H4R22_004970 [Coemansia sp. RSA 1290]|nr:hypothetical protein H4R22_004970 [Coemansia sp. RSA 1290]
MAAVGIPKLKVRPKKGKPLSPCAIEMAALATCWSSFSIDDNRCAKTANSLTACMQKARMPKPEKSDINYHLARLGRQVLRK